MNPPTIREELTRKSLETIEKVVQDRNSGRVNDAQYAYAIDVMWSMVAGLVDNDFNIMLEMMAIPKSGGSFCTKEFFRAKNGGLISVTNWHDGLVTVNTEAKTTNYSFKDGRNPYLEAKEKFREITDKLIGAGYEQL